MRHTATLTRLSHILIFLLALSASLAVAQDVVGTLPQPEQQKPTAQDGQSTEATLREKAFQLLESLADQINTLQSAENRARMGSNIAESLWDHDQKRARTLFALVEDDIKAGLQNREGDDPGEVQTFMVFLRLREITVERIAKHDAELALAFLKATKLSSDKPLPYGIAESERALELRLAKGIANDNPDQALKLGRESLALGLSDDLLSLLRQLNRKHRDQGVILYKETVLKLRNANLVRDWNLNYVAVRLADSLTPPLADDSTFRDLINILIASALANGCGNEVSLQDVNASLCWQLASLISHMEKIDPLRAAQLKRWAPGDPESWPLREANYELRDLNQNGTVDEILALVPKYPQMEDEIYWQALMKAQTSGDVERARKIANDYHGHPEQRRRMMAQIDGDQMRASMNDEKLGDIQRRLSTIPRLQDRARFLLSVVNEVGAKDRTAALNLINQASGIVDSMKPGKEQSKAQMGIAMMYCLEKSDQGLAIMESMIPKLNDLVAAAAKLDGYDNHYLRDGEWNMTGEGGIGDLLTALAKNAEYFAWCDFDRAVNLAAQFERPEIRLMAQLKLAQGILAGPPKRLLVNAQLR